MGTKEELQLLDEQFLEEKLRLLDEQFNDMEYNGCSLQYIHAKLFKCYRKVVEEIEGKPYGTFGPELSQKYPRFTLLCDVNTGISWESYDER